MEFLASTYTPNTETIFAPLIETNSFCCKPSDQDDAGCKNCPEALQMARPADEALLQKLRQMLLEMGKSKQKLKCSPSSLMFKIKKDYGWRWNETHLIERILFESERIQSSLTMAGSSNSALKLGQRLASHGESVSLKVKTMI
ncbi:hypothetical protein PVL29_004721 [Vitis rotundifolia]|uniref:Uncharacterized protein n=1 Tax=Vitis rotundifolia TaxID=103349 RepID=A0AA39A8V8_VITRO|nr:hypothetical protein PVL29_004721 [Vitis rotundifolia]